MTSLVKKYSSRFKCHVFIKQEEITIPSVILITLYFEISTDSEHNCLKCSNRVEQNAEVIVCVRTLNLSTVLGQ